MTVDKEQIRKAMDAFQNDRPLDARKILKNQITKSKNEYLKTNLKLEKDPLTVVDGE